MKAFHFATIMALAALLAAPAAQAVTLYTDSFSGAATNINGVAVEGGALAPAVWSANATYMADGSLDETVEGSAVLPFEPLPGSTYELSVNVFNTTDRWVALGFARDVLTAPGADSLVDRFANELEGASWMLFRDHASDPTQDIQIFGGLRTNSGIADNNAAVTHNQVNTLKIVLNTAADGSNFTADFLLNGASVTSTGLPVTVNLNIDDINFVGLSYDDSTTAAEITVDNFLLTGPVPEPASLSLAGIGLLGMVKLRRRYGSVGVSP